MESAVRESKLQKERNALDISHAAAWGQHGMLSAGGAGAGHILALQLTQVSSIQSM
jgi:hypothetical protein